MGSCNYARAPLERVEHGSAPRTLSGSPRESFGGRFRTHFEQLPQGNEEGTDAEGRNFQKVVAARWIYARFVKSQ